MLAERGQEVTAMIELDVPEDELMTRLLKRGQESGRADDNEESMNTRIKTYFEVTEPVIEYYNKKGVLKTVDSGKGTEETFKEIEKILRSEDVNN